MVFYLNFIFEWNSLKVLPCVCFVRLGGWQRCVESEKGRWNKNVWETLL